MGSLANTGIIHDAINNTLRIQSRIVVLHWIFPKSIYIGDYDKGQARAGTMPDKIFLWAFLC